MSFVIGQYFKMRSKYASMLMLGMWRAWKQSVLLGALSVVRAAEVIFGRFGSLSDKYMDGGGSDHSLDREAD